MFRSSHSKNGPVNEFGHGQIFWMIVPLGAAPLISEAWHVINTGHHSALLLAFTLAFTTARGAGRGRRHW